MTSDQAGMFDDFELASSHISRFKKQMCKWVTNEEYYIRSMPSYRKEICGKSYSHPSKFVLKSGYVMRSAMALSKVFLSVTGLDVILVNQMN
jgi:hypothetical protein